jgi:hypothetical protein
MTSLATCLDRDIYPDTPTAGREGSSLMKAVWKERGRLKGESAWTSGVFHDLKSLAHEQGTLVEESPVFLIAQKMLLVLPADIPAPSLDVDSEGDVLLDWDGPDSRMLTIALRENGQISYAARLSTTKNRNGNDVFHDSIPHEIISLVRAVTERQQGGHRPRFT